jgi:hypothetical protein
VANRVLAGLTERSEMFFHAQQNATGSWSLGRALLLDVRLAGFAHGGGSYQRRSAPFIEILKMRLDAFREQVSVRVCGVTKLCHVARASRYGGDILPGGGRH